VSSAPIGVFDSGVGGLSVLAWLRRELPAESFVYLADRLHCPYGPRPADEILALSVAITHELLARGCKLIVVACNTASAVALSALRAQFVGVPIVGLVPALKPAVRASRSRVVGVLATPGTMRGSLLEAVIVQEATPAGVTVLPVVSPELVPLVEAGLQDSPQARAVLRSLLAPLQAAGADALVLGCTHYPFLAGALHEVAPELALYDSGQGVARRVRAVLETLGQLNPRPGGGDLTLLTTGEPQPVGEVIRSLQLPDLELSDLGRPGAAGPGGPDLQPQRVTLALPATLAPA
jgi:glutamate racemase